VKLSNQFTQSKWVPILSLLALGLIAYANAVGHPFVHDDLTFILYNPSITSFDNISQVFFKPSLSIEGVEISNPYYRPLLDVLYRMEYQLFGLNPKAYHFFNIMIHLVNGVLVFQILNFITGRQALSWIVSALFIVHPIQTEAVACVSGISNLIYVLLSMGSLLLYLVSCRNHEQGILVLTLGGVFFFLALFSKEQSLTVLFLIILFEHTYGRKYRRNRKVRVSFIGIYFLIVAGYFVWRKIVLGRALVPLFDYGYELTLRLFSIPRTLLMYFKTLLYPLDLHYYRSINVLEPPGLSPVILIVILVILLLMIRRLPKETSTLLSFGIGWFVLAIFPVLNIIPLIHEYSWIATFEHFLYLPMIGFFLSVFALLEYCCLLIPAETVRKSAAVLMGLLIVPGVILTVKQNTYWRGEIPLFERAIQFEKNLGRLNILLAGAYYDNEQYDLALEKYHRALFIMRSYDQRVKNPEAKKFYSGFMKKIYFKIGLIYEIQNDDRNAVRFFLRASALAPLNGEIHNHLGIGFIELRNIDKAVYHFQQVLISNPYDLDAMNNLAGCHMARGEFQDAEKILLGILEIDQNSLNARRNLEYLRELLLQKEAPSLKE